jgi:hypothetical protein
MFTLNELFVQLKSPAQYLSHVDLSFWLSSLELLGVFAGILLLAYLIVRFLLIRKLMSRPQVILEVNPLRITEQSPFTTEQLFNMIHGLARQVSRLYRVFNVSKNYAFEIVSTKEDGIRYLVRVDKRDVELVEKSLLSYLPGLVVKKVNDYIPTDLETKPHRISEFKLSNHFVLPLKKQESLDKHDPIAYMTGSMTKLSKNELIAFQLVVSPTNKRRVPDIKRISKLIYSRNDLVVNINNRDQRYPWLTTVRQIVRLLLQILLFPVGLLVFLFTDGKEGPFLSLQSNNAQKKTSNPYQQEMERLVKDKLDQQLFTTSMRLLVIGDTHSNLYNREKGFVSALSSFNNSSYQSLIKTLKWRINLVKKLKRLLFTKRLLKPLSKSILSSSEIGDIYHFPFTRTTKTEDLVRAHSKQLPAPVSLKRTKSLDIIFAENHYGGDTTKIGLTQDERRRHMYILGATGTGKTTMLLSMIQQDIQNGKGLCLIDPHGDLVEDILHIIPKNRIKDVVYFNPDDIGYPTGINLLELTPGLKGEDAIREKEFIAESIISLFHKIYTEKYSGPRMEYILRNTIHTAFTVPNATLFTIYKLLINTGFRKSVVRNLKDENLLDFWKYEFAKAGDYQKVKMISPITNKIGRFLFSPTAKRILEQDKSTINFDEIMNEGKILLSNVSKGKIGEDNSEVFGVVIMAKIQLAALKRARMAMKDRKDFYLYVDEFQNFATPAFAQILSEARKYKLGAVLAHQTTSQIEDKSLINITLANTGTVICFRTANPEDEKLILPQFQPYVEKGEIASLPSFRFYMRLGALNPEEPFSGTTTLTTVGENSERVDEVITSSRARYAIKYVEKKTENYRGGYIAKKKPYKSKRKSGNILP